MIRLVLFDIDGTLIHPRGAGRRAFLRAAEQILVRPVDGSGVEFAGRTDRAFLRDLIAAAQSPEPAEVAERDFFDAYLRHLEGEIRIGALGTLCAGVDRLLDRLAMQDAMALGLLTGNIEAGARLKLAFFGIADRFPFGAYGSDAEDRRDLVPVARRRAVEVLGPEAAVAPALVIGDTPYDVECARSGGASVIAVATGTYSFEELRTCAPDRLFRDLSRTEEVVEAILDLTPLSAPPPYDATPRRGG